ncbi:hypothetical protein LPB41_21405 [Thalassospira sp. MA62]|nr:hypothetical protein [Thalassospira sp. MA62]
MTTAGAYRQADDLTVAAHWSPDVVETPHFTLQTYLSPVRSQNRPMVVYIEGDGFAWLTGDRVSPDPTPRDPFMLRVALQDQYFNAVYLARPCQYVIEKRRGANCQSALWTDARFNQVVIDDMSIAIDQLLARRSHRGLILVGGSGGGSVAMLIAAHRDDVNGIVTMSGLFNHRRWTRYHDISPLGQSLNPANFYTNIASVAQLHLLAADDDVIPAELSKDELLRLKHIAPRNVKWLEVSGLDHSCCWDHYWTDHYREIVDDLMSQSIGLSS